MWRVKKQRSDIMSPIQKARARYLADQRKYVEQLDGDYNIVSGAFVLSMRKFGYNSTFAAVAELIDNAIQARAKNIIILIKTVPGNTQYKYEHVGEIVVIDDGFGMEPEMIRAALKWGGTHRYNDRSGIGRFGVGLPAAAGTISPRYTVYSKLEDGEYHAVNYDIMDLVNADYKHKKMQVPNAKKMKLPNWINNADGIKNFNHGTAVWLKEPDSLSAGYVKPSAFLNNMQKMIGITYRNFSLEHNISVIEYHDKKDNILCACASFQHSNDCPNNDIRDS